MECSEALDLLYSSFDGQITPAEQSLLNGHRRTCFACAASLLKAERFQELLRHVPQLSVPRGLEQRVINRVLAGAHVSSPASSKVLAFTNAFRQSWRGFSLAGAAMAAAFVAFMIANGTVQGFLSHQSATETVTAMVAGSLQDVRADNTVAQVQEGSAAIRTGETLQNAGEQPATVAITPHLALTINAHAKVHFNKVHTNPTTLQPDIIDLHLDRGQIAVREVLHRDASPIHVATNLATIVPMGTTFAVEQRAHDMHVSVMQGTVAVYLPGKVVNVPAGQALRVALHSYTRETLAGKPLAPVPQKSSRK